MQRSNAMREGDQLSTFFIQIDILSALESAAIFSDSAAFLITGNGETEYIKSVRDRWLIYNAVESAYLYAISTTRRKENRVTHFLEEIPLQRAPRLPSRPWWMTSFHELALLRQMRIRASASTFPQIICIVEQFYLGRVGSVTCILHISFNYQSKP